jgi:predicted transcriptional regulator
MARRAKPAAGKKPRSSRVSVSLSPALHHTLAAIAKDKKVSVAWVVRDAVDKYVADQWPLLEKN